MPCSMTFGREGIHICVGGRWCACVEGGVRMCMCEGWRMCMCGGWRMCVCIGVVLVREGGCTLWGLGGEHVYAGVGAWIHGVGNWEWR